MRPTLEEWDVVIGIRTTDIHKGDVITFKKNRYTLTKRVIAEGGDILTIKNDHYYINGKKEPYKVKGKTTGKTTYYKVPENCYFVSGDNRENSLDSRDREFAYVRKNEIRSKMIYVIGKGAIK